FQAEDGIRDLIVTGVQTCALPISVGRLPGARRTGARATEDRRLRMGHTLRGAVSAWLALIVLQTVVTRGSGRVADALAGLNGLAQRALDPNVPAIPDRRTGAAPAGAAGGFFRGLTPEPNQAINDAKNVNPAAG